MLKLAFIENINRMDTPRFTSITNQELFFNSRTVFEIEAYYPPHYTNSIRLTYNDLDINSNNVNYAIIEFQNKQYYYFIDRINYINQEVYELIIDMDTIQTYMFNVDFVNSNVTRKSIKRWHDNGYEINRNYIRENVSHADSMQVLENNNYATSLAFVIAVLSESLENRPSNVCEFNIQYNNDDQYQGFVKSNLHIYLFPIYFSGDDLEVNITVYDERTNTTNIVGTAGSSVFDFCTSNPSLVNMYVINNPVIMQSLGLSYDENTRILTVRDLRLSEYYPPFVIARNDYMYVNCYRLYKFGNIGAMQLSQFLQSTNQETPRSYVYVPQLLDENYFELIFGEKLGYTSFPLHKLKEDRLFLRLETDISNNSRIYKLTETLLDNDDTYHTTIINRTNEDLNTVNNAWLQYKSINHGTLTTGVDLAKQNAVFNFIGSVANTAVSTATGLSLNGEVSTVRNIANGVRGVSNLAMSMYNIDQNLKVTRENLEYTPDTVKQGNNALLDLLSNAITPFSRLSVVEDIESCAERFENYGYKVNEYTSDNLFNYVNIRYYYNILQASEVVCNFRNILVSEELKLDFINRITNGLRLWNVETNGGTTNEFRYDNVEIDFIGEE